MKQQFSDTPQNSLWGRLQEHARQGGVQRVLGLILVGLLALAGALGALFTGRLGDGTVSEKHYPPYNPTAQRLLYHPSEPRIDSVSRGADGFLGARTTRTSASTQADRESARPRIVSRPLYTAVVGETYEYHVQVAGTDGPESSVEYALDSGPSEATIDATSGRLEWTPRRARQGTEQTIAVAAYGEDGKGTTQTFRVYVSATAHPLGTDWEGRDMGAALLLGARWALLPGCIAVVVSMLFGILAGGLAGYYEGAMDSLLTYVSNLVEAVPSLVLLFLGAIIFKYNIFLIMGVVGIILFPRVASAVKSEVQSLKAQQFVEASQELGLRDRVILWRDIVWYNARPQLLLQTSRAFVFAIVVEVTLSYLNLGIQSPTVSWGNLLAEGRRQLSLGMYGPVVLTSMVVIASVGAFYLLADGIRRWYEISQG